MPKTKTAGFIKEREIPVGTELSSADFFKFTPGALSTSAPTPVDTPPTQRPAGATQIFDPAELKGLTESQIFRDPTSERIFRRQQATLTSPQGEKRVVDVGSQEANDLLGAGYTLGDKIGGGTVDAVTGDSLTPEDDVDLTGAQTDQFSSQSPDETIVSVPETSKSIQAYMDLLTPPETEAGKEVGDLTSQISELLGETAGREALLAQKLEKQKVTEMKQKLTTLNNEINIRTAALQKRLAELEATPMTLARLSGAQAQATRTAQTDIMFLQASAQAMMDNITFAQQIAQDAVDAKYNPILKNINIKIAQLELITPIADKDEKRYIDALNLVLADQANAATEAKAKETSIQNIVIKAIENGITNPNVLAEIGNAGSVIEATQIMGSNVPTTADQPTISEQLAAQKEGFTIQDGKIVPKPTVTSTGNMVTTNFNYRDVNVDSVASPSLNTIHSQASDIGGLITGAVATSTFRTREQQQELFNAFQAGGPQAAPPGQSAHERGMAIDLFPDQSYIEQMKPIMEANGWFQTAGAHDLGHFEFMGTAQELTPSQVTAGNALAKRIYGSTAIKSEAGYENFVEPILDRMRAGESIDDIADDIRFQGQSTAFTGAIRDAAQQITSDWTDKKTEIAFDKLDDLLSKNDLEGVQDHLRKLARDDAGVDQQRMVQGSERTVEFLDEIAENLIAFEAAGGKTNIFHGTAEKVAGKVGAVKEEELRKIATKISTAIQKYRRAMSGVAFSVPESKEYKELFPNIDKTANFNRATIEALREVLGGDVDFFYSNAMGSDAYSSIFKEGGDITEDEFNSWLNSAFPSNTSMGQEARKVMIDLVENQEFTLQEVYEYYNQ